MRYFLIYSLVLLAASICEPVACQKIESECVYKFLPMHIDGGASTLEIKLVVEDHRTGEVKEEEKTATIDELVKLEADSETSLDNIKWYIRELGDPWPEHPQMECDCGDWGTLKIYYNGELKEVRP